jgi:hypothetical protein
MMSLGGGLHPAKVGTEYLAGERGTNKLIGKLGRRPMRSRSANAGALVIMLGAPLAIAGAAAIDNAAEVIIHLALGTGFLLFARAAFDFGLPRWASILSFATIGVFALLFLLQAAADLTQSLPLRRLAYDILGQRLEKILGYGFLVCCAGLLAWRSTGWIKVFGAVVFALVVGVEVYSFAMSLGAGQAPQSLKLLYLPLFVWLLAEGARSRPTADTAVNPALP